MHMLTVNKILSFIISRFLNSALFPWKYKLLGKDPD